MKFFQSLYRSLFDLEWLRAKRDTRIWAGIGFLFVVVMTVTVFKTGPILGVIIPELVEKTEQKFRTDAPDFKFIMEEGKLRTERLPQPYTYTQTIDGAKVTLLIDTVSTTTPPATELVTNKNEDLAIVIGRDGFSVYDPESKEMMAETYADVPNGDVTKDQVLGWVENFRTKYLTMVLLGLGALLIVGAFVVRLVALAFWSLLIFVLAAKVKKLPWKFGEIYRVSLYASTLPLLVSAVTMWFGWTISLGSIVFLALMYWIVIEPSAVVSVKTEEPKA